MGLSHALKPLKAYMTYRTDVHDRTIGHHSTMELLFWVAGIAPGLPIFVAFPTIFQVLHRPSPNVYLGSGPIMNVSTVCSLDCQCLLARYSCWANCSLSCRTLSRPLTSCQPKGLGYNACWNIASIPALKRLDHMHLHMVTHLEDSGRHGLGIQEAYLPPVVPPAPHKALTNIDEDWQANPDPGIAHQPLMVFVGNCWAGMQDEGYIEDYEQVVSACMPAAFSDLVPERLGGDAG